jgi:hypothetical protein
MRDVPDVRSTVRNTSPPLCMLAHSDGGRSGGVRPRPLSLFLMYLPQKGDPKGVLPNFC